MDFKQVLARLRRILEEVDLATSDLTDEELLEAIEDARALLELRRVSNMETLVVVADQAATGYGISPEPTLEQGHMLALGAAVELLETAYRGRLDRGELGVSWQSGLESGSSISAQKAYRDAIDGLASQLEELKLIKRAPTSATRPQ